MLKSSTNAQELRLPHPEHEVGGGPGASPNQMDNLKTTFLPNLSMDGTGGVICPTTHYCPICGQQFERAQHAAEHMQLCHGIIAGIGGGLMLPTSQQHIVADTLSHEYPCLNCDDKFPSAQELDDHHRLLHQQAAFLARCLACGTYGISSTSLQEGDEYKCLHCGSICTAASLTTGHQPTYLVQQQEPHQAPHTPEEDDLSAMAPEDMNSMASPEDQHRLQLQQQQQQQQQQEHQQQQQQHHQLQQQLIKQDVREEVPVQRKVPPLTVKLNKNGNGGADAHPHVIIKQEPLSLGDSGGSGEITPTSVPVYTIQRSAGATSVVVSTAAVAAAAAEATATTVGNKVRHKCPDCPKTFKTPGTLAMHRKVHSGDADATPKERPYTCSYCGKSFTQSNTLKQHTRIHTGEKPYHCNYCEKSFSVKDYLTKHIRTHTGEKPYTCPYCDKRFTQRSALTVHTTKLHPL